MGAFFTECKYVTAHRGKVGFVISHTVWDMIPYLALNTLVVFVYVETAEVSKDWNNI